MIVVVEIGLSDCWHRDLKRLYGLDILDALRMRISKGIGELGSVLNVSYKEEMSQDD